MVTPVLFRAQVPGTILAPFTNTNALRRWLTAALHVDVVNDK